MSTYAFNGDYTERNFKHFLKWSADQNASDITINSGDYIWLEIHGRQIKATHETMKHNNLEQLIPAVWGNEIISLVKSQEAADRAIEVMGEEFGLERGVSIRYRCNICQARIAGIEDGYSIVIRIIPAETRTLDDLGIEAELVKDFFPGRGLVLICGPTASGKTTLQAAIYERIGSQMPHRKVITAEDPVEIIHGGPHWKGVQPAQSQIGRHFRTFSDANEAAMRRSPKIIGIGELRDPESCNVAITASTSGHLVYGTCHTDSVPETINRIIQEFPTDIQPSVANKLLGVIRVIVIQRLLKSTDGKRIALREYLIFDRELRNTLQEMNFLAWPLFLRKKMEAEKSTLPDKAFELYKQGLIEAEEFIELEGAKEFERRVKIGETE
ncbi:TPA: Flp pilus assembly complex ATPase component TadA [Salmonella enterica subsp. salamae serovar 35:g,m,s,t:-]|nr:Flp pilus assembly complex ATPase component TadA [Salmonella enterica subsp. salamae serovar 35:g,m,s,t:-]HCA3549699.1 Flp pilus assembly complex ATPase component TadA [Salmonella enterica subsp. salamae serovar 35:g,m,s,t:-]